MVVERPFFLLVGELGDHRRKQASLAEAIVSDDW
jgi:hypothetical protein